MEEEDKKRLVVWLFYIAVICAYFFSTPVGLEPVLQPLSVESGELTPKFLINVLGNW